MKMKTISATMTDCHLKMMTIGPRIAATIFIVVPPAIFMMLRLMRLEKSPADALSSREDTGRG